MEKISIRDNTVSAAGQLKKSDTVYCLGNENAPKRVLIIGNSITRHGPKAEIGWENDWGMAASRPENDYVHQLSAKLGSDYCFMVKHASDWERNYRRENILAEEFTEEKNFRADVIVIMLGENVHDVTDDESKEEFYRKLTEFVDFFKTENNRIILRTCIWKHDGVDETVVRVAKEKGLSLLDMNFIGEDERYLAIGKFWHQGVAIHPGDRGMEKIADLLSETIQTVTGKQ